MGIAIFSPQFSRMAAMSGLASPFQAMLALFMPSARAAQAVRSSSVRSGPRSITAARGQACLNSGGRCEVAPMLPHRTESRTAARPSRLKIVRRFEPGVSASLAGRMVISGRMADVCAELDRMERSESGTTQIQMF